jgi:hypothetical protein
MVVVDEGLGGLAPFEPGDLSGRMPTTLDGDLGYLWERLAVLAGAGG